MSKHTPGPWLYSEQVKPETGVVFGVFPIENDGSKWVCRLIADGKSDLKEVRANAALIAAAPEMLEMLRRLSKPSMNPNLHNEVLELINKAEGK